MIDKGARWYRRAVSPGSRPSLVLVTLLAAPSTLAAQPRPSVTLTYALAPGVSRCPDAGTFRAAVAARLGRDPFVAPSSPEPSSHGHLSVSILRVGRGVRALVAWDRADGAPASAREVSAPGGDCSEVVSAAALAVSVALDAMPTVAPPPASPLPEPPLSPATPAPALAPLHMPTPAPTPAPVAPARSSPDPWIFFGPVLGAGLSPGVDFGLGLDVGLNVAAFGLSVGVRADLPVVTPRTDGVGGSVHTQRLQAELASCWQRPFAGGTLRLHACALSAVTALLGAGRDVDLPREATAWLVTLGVRGAVDLRLNARFGLRLRVDALVPVGRAVVRLDQRVVWEGSWVQGGAALGVMFHFS